jgi:hypothetical protein
MSVLVKLAGLGATLGAGLLAKKMVDTARSGGAGQPDRKKEAHQGRGVPGIIWFALTAAGTGGHRLRPDGSGHQGRNRPVQRDPGRPLTIGCQRRRSFAESGAGPDGSLRPGVLQGVPLAPACPVSAS